MRKLLMFFILLGIVIGLFNGLKKSEFNNEFNNNGLNGTKYTKTEVQGCLLRQKTPMEMTPLQR